ncbi:MAG: hypothetical protein ACYC5A_08600 [Thermoleophilia bacterium]
MKKQSFRTCIACDDPIEQDGINLLVCDNCSDDTTGSNAPGHPAGRSRMQDIILPADAESHGDS